jgi:hypothetical protein
MNEHFDPLEVELAALQPREPSPQLRERIGSDLASHPLASTTQPRPAAHLISPRTGLFAVAAAIAACAILAFGLRPAKQPVISKPIDEVPPAPLAAAFDPSLPTVWNYQRALGGSPSAVDSLLDKHAAAAPTTDRLSAAHFFIRSDQNLQGEL